MWSRFRREHQWQIRELLFTVKLLSRNASAVAGCLIIAAMVFLAVFASVLSPYDPIRISLAERLRPPSAVHLFGTDELGRDILSRIMYGARISLRIGMLVVLIAGGLGALTGAISGYVGQRLDNLIMRVMDVILSFPPLVLALAVGGDLLSVV
jgi:peptide/nickel transport system permease protein